MSQTLNKSSNQVARESPAASTISSTFVASGQGGHAMIPVVLPHRNVPNNPGSLVHPSSQAFLLSEAVSLASSNPTESPANQIKNPQLAMRVVSNASLSNTPKLGKNVTPSTSLVNGTNHSHHPQPIAMKAPTSVVPSSNNHLQNSPQILPKQMFVNKVKVNNPTAQVSNNSVSIFSSMLNNPSRLILHQKMGTPSSLETQQITSVDSSSSSLPGEGKSSASGNSIPVVNPTTRQVNLMMLSGASSGQTIGSNNSVIIGQSGSGINPQSSTVLKQAHTNQQSQANAPKTITSVANYHPSISFSNVLVSSNQTTNSGSVNNSGILIKSQVQAPSNSSSSLGTPVSSNIQATTAPQNQLPREPQTVQDPPSRPPSTSLPVPIVVASPATPVNRINHHQTTLEPGVMLRTGGNNGNPFLSSQPQQHMSIIQQTPSNSTSNNANGNNKKRSRKQVLQTGTTQPKAHPHHHHNVDNSTPSPTTALLITTSNSSSASVTSSSISLTSSTASMNTPSSNNSIFGLRLVPVKSQPQQPQQQQQPSQTAIQNPTIRLTSNPASSQILVPHHSQQSNSTSDQHQKEEVEVQPQSAISSKVCPPPPHVPSKKMAVTTDHPKRSAVCPPPPVITNHEMPVKSLACNNVIEDPKPPPQPPIVSGGPNHTAKAFHFQSKADFKLKSLQASVSNSYLSLLVSDLLDKDYSNTNGGSSRKRTLNHHSVVGPSSSKRGHKGVSEAETPVDFKRECYLLWNTLLDLRIKQSRTQFVQYPIATTSTLDVTGWRLLQSTKNFEFLKNSEHHACTSLTNMETILCNYITSNKLSLNCPPPPSPLQSSSIKKLPAISPEDPVASCSSHTSDELYLSINQKRPRKTNDAEMETNDLAEEDVRPTPLEKASVIGKLDRTLDLIKGLQQRQKILWDRMSGLIVMTNSLMENHRYPALQIFDDLSLLLSHVDQGTNSPASNNGIEPITDSDDANQSDESIVKA